MARTKRATNEKRITTLLSLFFFLLFLSHPIRKSCPIRINDKKSGGVDFSVRGQNERNEILFHRHPRFSFARWKNPLWRNIPLFLTIITAFKGIPAKHRSRRVFGPRFVQTRFHSTLSRRPVGPSSGSGGSSSSGSRVISAARFVPLSFRPLVV